MSQKISGIGPLIFLDRDKRGHRDKSQSKVRAIYLSQSWFSISACSPTSRSIMGNHYSDRVFDVLDSCRLVRFLVSGIEQILTLSNIGR